MSIASTLAVPAASITAKGAKGKAQTVAFFEIAPAAFSIENGKRHYVVTIGKALPDDKARNDKALVKLARQETIVGVATARMPAGEFPRGCKDDVARMNFVRELLTSWCAPDTVNMSAKHKGRRSEVQQRIIRNAEQRASVYLAEVGAGNAQTDKATNDKARQTKGSQSQTKGKADKATPPTHAELVKQPVPVTGDDYEAFMLQQVSMLLDYDNKHAKKRPVEFYAFAEQLKALKQTANKAANARAETKARVAALAAAKADIAAEVPAPAKRARKTK